VGKRELVIIAAFVVIGAAAYQLTAVPARTRARRFSLQGLVESWRHNGVGSSAHVTVSTSGRWPAAAGLEELDVSGATHVTVAGEARADIAWTLAAEAGGPDESAAREAAAGTRVRPDDLGGVLRVEVAASRGAPVTSTLTLHVPTRLALRIEGARRTTIAGVASVQLGDLGGETQITDVTGAITGGHRNGQLSVRGAGSADLALTGTTTTIAGVRGITTIDSRNGDCRVSDAGGAVTITARAGTVTVERAAAAVRLTGTMAQFDVTAPRGSVRIDARMARVNVTLDAAVPVTAVASDTTLHLNLADDVPIALDAAAMRGTIDAREFALAADVTDGDARLRHDFGQAARVSLRTERGAIVITRRK
jgi:hypothetical protein